MKTAVEWLAEQYNLVDTAEYEQAKEMEKQQKGYSDEEVKFIISEALQSALVKVDLEQWFEQFKKK
jgi:hypothetical protein